MAIHIFLKSDYTSHLSPSEMCHRFWQLRPWTPTICWTVKESHSWQLTGQQYLHALLALPVPRDPGSLHWMVPYISKGWIGRSQKKQVHLHLRPDGVQYPESRQSLLRFNKWQKLALLCWATAGSGTYQWLRCHRRLCLQFCESVSMGLSSEFQALCISWLQKF